MNAVRKKGSSKRNRSAAWISLAALIAFVLLLAACGSGDETAAPAAPTAQLSAQEYFEEGNARYEQGDIQAAVDAYRQAAALDEQNAGYWHNLGVAQYSLNALDEARASFRRGLALEPDDAELNYLLGVVAVQFEELSEAETYLTRANQLDPELPEPYFGLGVLYRLQGKTEQAISAFETFLAIGPGQDPSATQMAQQELDALRAGQ
jgi:tetratricopeptide (TPR) repeat protein